MWYWIRTLIIVGIVTGLIWLFAEAESLREDRGLVTVLLIDDDGREVIDLAEGLTPMDAGQAGEVGESDRPELRAEITFQGSASAVDALVRRLPDMVARIGPGTRGVSSAPGRHDVDLLEVLRELPSLRSQDSAVTITAVNPPRLAVLVDTMTTREVPIEPRTPEGETDGPVEVRPRVARVTMPTSSWNGLPTESSATIRIDEATWRGLIPGQRTTLPGLIVQPPLPSDDPMARRHARVVPATADATVALLAKSATFTIPTVPVHVRIPTVEYGKWDVSIPDEDRILTDVRVTGPEALVRSLQDRAQPLVAFVPLTFEDLERRITSKEVVFNEVPSPLRFEARTRTVRLTITPRGTPAPTTPNGSTSGPANGTSSGGSGGKAP